VTFQQLGGGGKRMHGSQDAFIEIDKVKIEDAAGHSLVTNLSPLLSLGDVIANKIVIGLQRYCSSYNSLATAKCLRTVLNMLGSYFKTHPADLITQSSLYSFLFDFRVEWYTSNTITQRLDTRNSSWDVFIAFVNHLIYEGTLPRVVVPPGQPKLHRRDIIVNNTLFAQIKPKMVDNSYINSLVPISLERTDTEYLTELEIHFINARDIFLSCAQREISVIKHDMLKGKELIESVNYSELTRIVNSTLDTKYPYRIYRDSNDLLCHKVEPKRNVSRLISVFGPQYVNGYKNILARIKYEHDGYYATVINRRSNNTDKALINIPRTIPSTRILAAHLGLISARSIVPFFVYMLLKNPKFTVEGLADIDVEGKNGVTRFLQTAGDESTNKRMKIKKGRAKVEKTEILDAETKDVLGLLLQLTEPFRIYLKKQNDPSYNKLWLCGGYTGNERPYQISVEMIRQHFGQQAYRIDRDDGMGRSKLGVAKRSFLNSHAELKSYIKIATLSRLRTTTGLIKWFESGGDVNTVARTFGHSTKVSIDHYIPTQLQLIMNIRKIRQFQNLLIIAATADEPYMLDVSDFTSIEDLHLFLAHIFDNNTYTNELTKTLQSRMIKSTSLPTLACNNHDIEKILINISTDTLAILFLYEEHLNMLGGAASIEGMYDPNKSTPEFWHKLSIAIRTTILNEPSMRKLRPIYYEAVEKTKNIRGRLNFDRLKTSPL
jgi:hypothetical protein